MKSSIMWKLRGVQSPIPHSPAQTVPGLTPFDERDHRQLAPEMNVPHESLARLDRVLERVGAAKGDRDLRGPLFGRQRLVPIEVAKRPLPFLAVGGGNPQKDPNQRRG